MGCLKCGRDTISEQVFCTECQLEMKKYPVRPGTVVQLPTRKNVSVVKKTMKRRTVPLDDQVRNLKKRVRTLTILLIVVTVIAAALAVPAVDHLMENHFKIGQNYTTVVPTEGN